MFSLCKERRRYYAHARPCRQFIVISRWQRVAIEFPLPVQITLFYCCPLWCSLAAVDLLDPPLAMKSLS